MYELGTCITCGQYRVINVNTRICIICQKGGRMAIDEQLQQQLQQEKMILQARIGANEETIAHADCDKSHSLDSLRAEAIAENKELSAHINAIDSQCQTSESKESCDKDLEGQKSEVYDQGNTTYETNYDRGHANGRTPWQDEGERRTHERQEEIRSVCDEDGRTTGRQVIPIMEREKFSMEKVQLAMERHLGELKREGRDVTQLKAEIREVIDHKYECMKIQNTLESGFQDQIFKLDVNSDHRTMVHDLKQQIQEKELQKTPQKAQEQGLER